MPPVFLEAVLQQLDLVLVPLPLLVAEHLLHLALDGLHHLLDGETTNQIHTDRRVHIGDLNLFNLFQTLTEPLPLLLALLLLRVGPSVLGNAVFRYLYLRVLLAELKLLHFALNSLNTN